VEVMTVISPKGMDFLLLFYFFPPTHGTGTQTAIYSTSTEFQQAFLSFRLTAAVSTLPRCLCYQVQSDT
jgi:hypothetical protein